ncbi:MAG: hypothetical protein ACLP7O_12520 [Terracidiphilus sp.]
MANENQSGDLAAIIRNLKARRADLDASIASLERAYGATVSDEGLANPILLNSFDQLPTELPRGAFLGKNLPAAVKLYLSAMKKTQTIREIATALREGGVKSTSDNFENVITGCLNRMKSNGELLRFKDGWGLPEFYPESLRIRLSQEGTPKQKEGKKKAKKKTPQRAKPAKPLPDASSKAGLEYRIEEFVRGHKLAWFNAADILQALPDIEPKSLPLALGRLAKKHSWIKGADGKYREAE